MSNSAWIVSQKEKAIELTSPAMAYICSHDTLSYVKCYFSFHLLSSALYNVMVGQTEVKWKTACVWISCVCSLIAVSFTALDVLSDYVDKDCSYVETKVN